jgi:hypothetical protein
MLEQIMDMTDTEVRAALLRLADDAPERVTEVIASIVGITRKGA